jgi:hypothetical protein
MEDAEKVVRYPAKDTAADSSISFHALRVIEEAVLTEVSEKSQEGFLCDVFRPPGIPPFSQEVLKHWEVKLF